MSETPQNSTKSKSSVKKAKPAELTVISKVIKGDTYMVMADAAKEVEDEFADLYTSHAGTPGAVLALQPPYMPRQLKQLVSHNNILNQCVQAMEVNIDGTGYEFVSAEDGKEVDKEEVKKAEAFFNEPYPGKSFVSIRRSVRNDMESIGWGFMEVLRNMTGEVVAVRNIEGPTIRLIRLAEQRLMTYKMERSGKEIEMKIYERPRRFVQHFGATGGVVQRQFFKEFGCPLDLNRITGEWAPDGTTLKAEEKATELLYFGVDKDYNSPYFVPRWINQLPSVAGSRKAEEQNLEYLDAGGMPPAIIFIQGGSMVGDAAQQLRTYLSTGNRKKGRAVVVELASNSGSLDGSTGAVTAKVERFGAESSKDAMFQKYDEKCEEHVRVGFRLPPLFIGKSQDYNYATAVVAYQVAEAQVFQPERHEFDEIVNKTLMKALGFKNIKFKSKPISIKSIEELFKGLQLLDGKVDPDDFVREVNAALGTDLTAAEPLEEAPLGNKDPLTGLPYDKPAPPPDPNAQQPGAKPGEKPAAKAPVKKAEQPTALQLIVLARKYAEAEGIVPPIVEMSAEEAAQVKERVAKLDNEHLERLTEMVEAFTTPVHEHAH